MTTTFRFAALTTRQVAHNYTPSYVAAPIIFVPEWVTHKSLPNALHVPNLVSSRRRLEVGTSHHHDSCPPCHPSS